MTKNEHPKVIITIPTEIEFMPSILKWGRKYTWPDKEIYFASSSLKYNVWLEVIYEQFCLFQAKPDAALQYLRPYHLKVVLHTRNTIILQMKQHLPPNWYMSWYVHLTARLFVKLTRFNLVIWTLNPRQLISLHIAAFFIHPRKYHALCKHSHRRHP